METRRGFLKSTGAGAAALSLTGSGMAAPEAGNEPNIVLIIVDRNILRQAIYIIIDGFVLATVVTLVTVFPFDFDVIPNTVAAAATNIAVTVILICIAVGFGISLLVRVIKLLVNIAKAATGSQESA